MHRIAATPGGWNPDTEGVIFVEQTPAPIVILTAADTDIQTLVAAVKQLPDDFPALRVVNLLQLQQQLTIDTYAELVLTSARVIILRLLGGRAYWSYGLEVLQETVRQTGAALIVLPGDDRPDPDLLALSTVSLSKVNQVWRYFTEGGSENCVNALKFVADICLGQSHNPPPPQEVPRVGLYRQEDSWTRGPGDAGNDIDPSCSLLPKVGLLFYRAHYLAGNTLPIDALCQALAARQLEPVPVFVSSLRDRDVQAELSQYFQPPETAPVQLILNTTSFAVADFSFSIRLEPKFSPKTGETPIPQDLWEKSNSDSIHNLDVPVLQVILSGGTVEQWSAQFQGLSPRDMAMNVALPEVDGRIITRAVSFKAIQTQNSQLETDVVIYQPHLERIEFVAELAANWVRLRQTPPEKRRIALILANYPCRDGRLANGVGLDTPASCVEILKALQQAGYWVENIPATGDELMQRLTAGVTNDPEGQQLRPAMQQLSLEEYQAYFATLPVEVQKEICDRWGIGNGSFHSQAEPGNEGNSKENQLAISNYQLAIPGIQLGNIFVGIQPSRGYDLDPSLNYHAPDLEPPHNYLAFYYWVRKHFGCHAIAHIGKHGNLEWLPGKSVALSNQCYPEIALGALPHLYPFIVNDPGEGSSAKRRAQAVIIAHLTPPMTRAELYGPLQQLESLIDEYYEAQNLDPSRLPAIRSRIAQLVEKENLHQDLQIANRQENQLPITNYPLPITQLDGYLCELKEAQIRDGLHIFGQCPPGRQLRDLIVAIARHPGVGRLGLTRALAQDFGLDFDPLTADMSAGISHQSSIIGKECRTVGDMVELLEEHAAKLVEQLISECEQHTCTRASLKATQRELDWIRAHLLPALQQTHQEITNLLRGLDGRFVPPAPSGAPTRGRPEVLPTGRNFYSVDIRGIPTETAWDVGRKAAEALIERYAQENGEYPKALCLSVWGTSTMRTGGDDIAEALALIGVQPVWDGPSRRVVDFEILPISILGRPRVDVTLRISGFFRDAFPNLIDLFDQAVAAVAALDETPDGNPLAAAVRQETQMWIGAGVGEEQALVRSRYRIFGSKPGAYGAGLQGLIESQNWTDEQDLARAYINWSCYAYTSGFGNRSFHSQAESGNEGKNQLPITNYPLPNADPEAFEQRLRQMQIVLHNQDNREHDLLDSDDYYQFQGGLTASVRALTGKNPQTYFGDNSIPSNPKVRQLKSEIARVYRSRVVNPKWIAGAMRHGYKGAFEIAATVDYLFAYDATANCVEDFMYEGVAEAYLFAPDVQAFIQQKNPWALRDMAERLLEANQRGLWQKVDPETVDKLRAIAHQAEANIEATNFTL
ncbi:cobaltochelatase subunit CobN [Microseira sp. BLCC-F43]|jgi:cobaltochelatase CobN|uniref:cobaltochelatase subunit CobN n=1 Tax=Microseira sp. BLCC-F43 TaxID=3153602 RepID=UPI0035B8B12C